MEDQVGSSQEYRTPGQQPVEGNYYVDPQGPRFNNPAEFDQGIPQPPPASMPPMPDFQALKEAALQQAINQVRPTPQPQAEPRVVYVRRNLTIAELILEEHPQIIALIISYLEPGIAADVLNLLPENIQSDIVKRIATLQTIQPEALTELNRVMHHSI